MTTAPLPPPLPSSRDKKDLEHLGLVAIFHLVMAGCYGIGLLFLWMHYTLMQTVLTNPQLMKGPHPFPSAFFSVLKWVYLVLGCLCIVMLFLNAISARCIQRRRFRIFSMVVAGLDCLQIPVGTALGVFTFMVLSRDFVRTLYVRSELA